MAPSKFMLHTYSLWEVNFFQRRCNGTYFLKSLERYRCNWWCFPFQDSLFTDSLPFLCHVVYVDRRGCLSSHIESDFESVWVDLANNLFHQKKWSKKFMCLLKHFLCPCMLACTAKKVESQLEFKDWVTQKSGRSVFNYAHCENIQSGSYSHCDWLSSSLDDCMFKNGMIHVTAYSRTSRPHVSASFKPWEPTSSSPRVLLKPPC